MAAVAPPNCNITPSELMQKFYQIVQIVQTLGVLIAEIRALCVKNMFRYAFGIMFYFTPQLNPFRFIDAYEAAIKGQKKFVFSCTDSQNGDEATPSAKSAPEAEGSSAAGETTNNAAALPEAPSACGSGA